MPALTVSKARERRHKRVRGKIAGTAERPRLVVTRSNRGIFAQLVDDRTGKTIVASNWLQVKKTFSGNKTDQATEVGRILARNARKEGINKIVFDRGGYLYHGRVKALADALRGGGLEF